MNKMVPVIWRPIPNFKNYEISDAGQIRNIETGRILKSISRPGWVSLRRLDVSYRINAMKVRDEVFPDVDTRSS